MRYENTADIYSANERFRDGLLDTLAGITEVEATAFPDGEKWSIQMLAEHIAIVDTGIARICTKLLEGAKAAGKASDGSFSLSEQFTQHAAASAAAKLEAPDRVQPSGNMTIAESRKTIEQNAATFATMRPDLEAYDLAGHTFPHPYFGPLTAGEWLVMAGLHKARHTRQIEALAERVRSLD